MHNIRRALALAIPIIAAACTTAPRRADVAEVVEAERAFARLAEDIGVRPAFTANFADDAVWMIPAPTTLAAAYASRPAPADPRAVRLEWAPAIAGIATSGELGFTSGPSTLSLRDGSRPPSYGLYFSMWKRAADGRWRVALDVGVQSPVPLTDAALQPAPAIRAAPPIETRDTVEAPLARERRGAWDAQAIRASLADDARLLRDEGIVRGPTGVAAALGATLALQPIGGDISQARDLAYTYGRFDAGGANGYYVHLWTRSERGEWKLAMIVRP